MECDGFGAMKSMDIMMDSMMFVNPSILLRHRIIVSHISLLILLLISLYLCP